VRAFSALQDKKSESRVIIRFAPCVGRSSRRLQMSGRDSTVYTTSELLEDTLRKDCFLCQLILSAFTTVEKAHFA
jgi:hypothetical protein